MDFIEAGLTLKKENFKERLLTIYNENIFSFAFYLIVLYWFHRSSVLEPETNYQLFNMIIGFGYKYATAPTR